MLGNKLLNIQFAKYHIWNNKSEGFPNMVLTTETFNQSVRTEYSEAVNARYTFQPLWVSGFTLCMTIALRFNFLFSSFFQFNSHTTVTPHTTFALQHCCCNRPYSYSQYWTGTSLQWRLMRGNILKSICILKDSPALASIASYCSSSPIPRIRICSIRNLEQRR